MNTQQFCLIIILPFVNSLNCIDNTYSEISTINTSTICFIAFNNNLDKDYKIMHENVVIDTIDGNSIINIFEYYIYKIDFLHSLNKYKNTNEPDFLINLYNTLAEENKLTMEHVIDNISNPKDYDVNTIILHRLYTCIDTNKYIVCGCYTDNCNTRYENFDNWLDSLD